MRHVIFVFLLVFAAGTSPSFAKSDLIWGVNGHPFVSYPGVSYDEQLRHLRELGLTSYRVDVNNIDMAQRLKKLVDLAKPHGIEILPVLTPGFGLDKTPPEQLYSQAKAFAIYFVSRFKNDIRVWELGNEMENYAIIQPCETQDDGKQYNCAWGPAGGVDPLEYYGPRWAKVSAVLKGLSDGVKSIDPGARKAIGTAGWGHVGAFDRMAADGIEWDISVWHMYGEDPEWAFKKLAGFGKPIWVTEFNHPGGSKKSVVEQAAGLKSTMLRLRELQKQYKIEAAHIYELLDETYWAPDFEAYMGLVYLDKNEKGGWRRAGPKPAHCVVQTLLKGGFRLKSAGKAVTASVQAEGTKQPSQPQRRCDLCLFDNRDTSAANKVAYSYCLLLGREADGGGLATWQEELKTGLSQSDMLLAMIQSDEFVRTHQTEKLNNPGYVGLMYRLLLDRDADGQGLADYTAALDEQSITRTGLAEALIGSDEFRSKHSVFSK
jgi:hypothetical protein